MNLSDPRPKYTIHVRGLVEYLLRHGDIAPGDAFFSPERAQLGAEIHRKLQAKAKIEIADYIAEKTLRCTREKDGIVLELEGRCDGFYCKDGTLHIDEFKTIEYQIPDSGAPDPLHTAQAVCYAAMLAAMPEYRCDQICIHIQYIHIADQKQTEFCTNFKPEEVSRHFTDLTDEYFKWILPDANRRSALQKELQNLKFPFSSYRKGQRELAVSVYKTIAENAGANLYVNAPTGTGKTISMLFPALKAMCREESGVELKKIFYLTATNAGSAPPGAAACLLSQQLSDLLSITLTAKEKICPKEAPECNPESCDRARGHYDRINDCLYDALLNAKQFTKDSIAEIACRHCVCPFELQLDLSLWCDIIIGDYNYLFDPTAKLQRYFGEMPKAGKKLPYVYLIDEAHNLPDRARAMYSASLSKKQFMEFSRLLKEYDSKPLKNLRAKASKINSFLIAKGKELEQYPSYSAELDKDFTSLCAEYTESAYELLKEKAVPEEIRKPFLELYFETDFFCDIAKYYDENYYAFYDIKEKNISYTLFCASPAALIQACANNALSAVFFSGTLLPFGFYREAIGADREKDRFIKIPSPFPAENRLAILAADVYTTYSKRANYYGKIAKYIVLVKDYAEHALNGKGNFMIFFSSYKFLDDVAAVLDDAFLAEYVSLQPRNSNLEEREAFLESFQENPEKIHIGLCVLGGVFSEGIDLPGSRLSGAVIVGVGLPMVCAERELISLWHERRAEGTGFLNAYVYPGVNKVIQAAGRVIRTAEDRGFVIFLDNRYFGNRYESLFPEDYIMKKAKNLEEARALLFDLKL
ncbi:MAG: ATP-dependent DNA helicase [Clostridia bacterium]